MTKNVTRHDSRNISNGSVSYESHTTTEGVYHEMLEEKLQE